MARAKASGDVYQLKITLADIRPPIWRRVQVRDCTLDRLHDLIQVCFGWEDYHLHSFDVAGEHYGDPEQMQELDHTPERKMSLSRLVASGVKKFIYTYDFGDNWEHVIQIEKTLSPEPGVKYPRCVAGKRSGPPEDCGGPWGYGDFVDAVTDPSNPRHEELLEWVGGEFDPEAFDLDEINKELEALR
jgi:hypothetical protein